MLLSLEFSLLYGWIYLAAIAKAIQIYLVIEFERDREWTFYKFLRIANTILSSNCCNNIDLDNFSVVSLVGGSRDLFFAAIIDKKKSAKCSGNISFDSQ